jgi:hypothetical protein
MRTRKAFLAAVAACVVAFGGCVNFQVDEHSYQFNEATGSLSLRLLLLNAVRASKDYPLQFTKITQYQGEGTSSASLSVSLPLATPGTGSISPKMDVKDGISQLDLVDLNTAEAQEALKSTVPLNAFSYFYTHSGSRSLVVPWMVMVEHVAMLPDLHELITRHVDNRCRAYLGNGGHLPEDEPRRIGSACQALDDIKRECPDLFSTAFVNAGGGLFFRNVLTSECQSRAFIAVRLQFAVIRASFERAPKAAKDDKPENGKEGGKGKESGRGAASGRDRPSDAKRGPGNTFYIYAVDPKAEKSERDKEDIILRIYDKSFTKLCESKEGMELCVRKPEGFAMLKKGTFGMQLRSPERMVRYLGELISAQSYGPRRFVPKAFDAERGEWYTLLTVKRGNPPLGESAVSVTSPDGEAFYIPRRNYDLPKTDLSLETLSVVTEVLNAAVSKKAFPPVTSLTVRSD